MSRASLPAPVLLVLTSTYPRWQGDPEPGFVHELSKRLVGSFRVIVLGPHAPGARPRELMDGVEVVRYRYAPERWETLVNDGGIVANLKLYRWKLLLVPGFLLMQAWQAWRLCREEKVDVIHAHWLVPQGLIAALLQLLPGRKVPFLVTAHGTDLYGLRSKPLQILKRFVLQCSGGAAVVSNAMREVVAHLGMDEDKVSVAPMGVDMAQKFVPPDDPGRRSRHELLFVGRLVENKGLEHLLAALPLVLQEHPDVTLTIAGFGPHEAQLKAQTQMLGLALSVRFLGALSQKDLPPLYQRAALFVAPFVRAETGEEEGLGLVLVEAIGCGCPVLAGNVSGVRDLLGHDDWYVDPRDTQALATAILRLLDEDQRQTQDRVQALRSALLTRLGWDHVASRYAGLLKSSLSCAGEGAK